MRTRKRLERIQGEKMTKEWIEARIEQIGTGRHKDNLMISNRKNHFIITGLFNGYKQLGTYDIDKPHTYKEREDILIQLGPVEKKFLWWKWTAIDITAVKGDITT